jgi:DNA-binding NarL/FixJ family response regulator
MDDTTPQRVLLADGDANVRRALALLLQTVLGLEIVGEAADLTGLSMHPSGMPSACERPQADLLLVDWAGIAPTAPQLLARLRALNRQLRVIVLSTRPEVRVAALAAGADAFLSKVDQPELVLAAVRQVLADRPTTTTPPI